MYSKYKRKRNVDAAVSGKNLLVLYRLLNVTGYILYNSVWGENVTLMPKSYVGI